MTNKALLPLLAVSAVAGLTGCKEDAKPEAAEATKVTLEQGHEYMVVSNRPSQMHVIDLESEALIKSCDVPGDFGPGTLQIAPDHVTAYMLTDHYEKIYAVNLDSCDVVFSADMSQAPDERAKTLYSMALSPDGKELYTIQTPTKLYADHYEAMEPRLAVYDTASGKDAKPVRTFEVPRQISVMQVADDGTLYMAGADIYKMDVTSGKVDVAIPSRNWERPLYAPPDVLNVWPIQTPQNEFTILYSTAKFTDETYDMNTATWLWGYFNVDLETGETETRDFAEFTEIYFTGMRSPADPNIMFGVLNHLAKYDIKEQKLVKSADLEHSYYTVAMNHAGSKVYLGGTFNDVAVYDAETLEKTNDIPLPGGDISPSTAQVFIR
ncbi:MAG: quinohemoprotein amine dehydrogenase subunit beta [Oceanospirillaceae bacterium]|nr:quinohemoprotein amine dehydrogenase subunit beta [Oceanospirillaceae bacterium]MBT10633.1 quinohemoprotein amine dehydrogenase subunit beta [Oceanospirillaceae bacterium]